MLTNDKYNDPKAVAMREELRDLQSDFEELKYRMTVIAKNAKEKEQEYLNFLGILDENDEKEKGNEDGC